MILGKGDVLAELMTARFFRQNLLAADAFLDQKELPWDLEGLSLWSSCVSNTHILGLRLMAVLASKPACYIW